ncbi:Alpha/beta hydrolase [Flavobacterium longum]|uniref:alpha/beta hydrolase n=1 Tax=Flavobacterium longum TaxID=1299340 RepID=UPI0039E8FF84
MGRRIVKIALLILFILGTIYVAFQVSPYPSVWIVRYFFEKEAKTANDRLSAFVPGHVSGIADIGYDTSDPDALLDVYYPKEAATNGELLPLIVWTHGGGLISGKKEHLENYCRMLAGEGFVVAAIDYTVAPKGKYPLPLRQLNLALGFLSTKASVYHADASRIILAGDSGGAMLSAQMANIISSEKYAKMVGIVPKIRPRQLKGTLLYCGIYDVTNLNTGGEFGGFLKTVLWAYFGKKDIFDDRYAQSASVVDYLTPNFPASFISAGNKDPLLEQSRLLSAKLREQHVVPDTLFYPAKHHPELAHEYQFTYDESGKAAFSRSIAFLRKVTR